MKKLLFLIVYVLIGQSLYSQTEDIISIGTKVTLDSKILSEEREVWIYVPSQGPDYIYGTTNYPVVYLLDGNSHFHSFSGMVQKLSNDGLCPQMIVVAILNTNRDRDLTPTKASDASHPYVTESRAESSGGGENFMGFIEKELMPHINSNYPVESYSMLVGHSFGGLTVINAFLKQTELFNSYISIDPSMWWDNEKLLKEIEQTKFDERFQNKSLYLSIANTLQPGMDLETAQADTTFETAHFRSIFKADASLKRGARESFKYLSKYYPDDDHGTVPFISEYDGLRFIFDFYALKIDESAFKDPNVDLIKKVNDHANELSKAFGHDVKPLESLVNDLGYQLMENGALDRAEEFFKLNITNYPKSANVYDSMGDFYIETKQNRMAIKNLRKAVELGAPSYSQDKLDELLKN